MFQGCGLVVWQKLHAAHVFTAPLTPPQKQATVLELGHPLKALTTHGTRTKTNARDSKPYGGRFMLKRFQV